MKFRAKSNGSHRRGYLLVMTVFVLAIAGLFLVSISSLSVERSLEAIKARRDVRLKWASSSCKRLALGTAKQLIESNDGVQAYAGLKLAEANIEIWVADESAKLNLNFVASNASDAEIKSTLREWAAGELELDLSPLHEDSQDFKNDAFESWGQVFRQNDAEANYPELVIRETRELTLWGKRLNLDAASPEVVYATVEALASESVANRFVNSLDEIAEGGLDAVISNSAATQEQRRRLKESLSTSPQCYSVWMRVVQPNRVHWSLTVRGKLAASIWRTYNFTW